MVNLLLAIIYLSFVSLGLPDSLLGSAWPVMYGELQVAVSSAGIISAIIAAGTIVSSLLSDRLTRRFGVGIVTVSSVGMTALALFGFSVSHSFVLLCLWAIPYGLGAGSVDAALNNYVSLHYASRHMSWLHCMWGLGASIGPYIMSYALSGGRGWNVGYRYISLLQIGLTVLLVCSLPLWKENRRSERDQSSGKALSLREIVALPGAKETMLVFFCYCAVEQTAALWASSYLVLHKGYAEETAARFASLFFIGITVGRGISGFITMKLNDTNMVRLGQAIIAVGAVTMLFSVQEKTTLISLILIGLGCAPIYPCIIHATPSHFGADRSQAVIGVQMASAYIGTCLMPPLFGLIANYITISLFPFYLLAVLLIMLVMHEGMLKKTMRAQI